MRIFRTIFSLRRFKEKVSMASGGTKFAYFFWTLIQFALACGFGVVSYLLFNKSGDSALQMFMVILAFVAALCAVILAIFCIVKFIILATTGSRNPYN